MTEVNQQFQQLYVAFDRVAQTMLGQVMQFPHDAPAVRMFVDALQDGFMAKHPGDFELLCIGTIGMVTCEIVPNESPRLVLSGETWAQTLTPKEEQQ